MDALNLRLMHQILLTKSQNGTIQGFAFQVSGIGFSLLQVSEA